MSSSALASVFARTSAILLDFDGPVCSVFSAFSPAAVARELRARLDFVDLPVTNEPFEILYHVAQFKPLAATRAEAELAELETTAVRKAEATPGADTVLRHFKESGRRVVVVSNNSAAAVRAYLAQHDLDQYVTGIASRVDPNPALLKPHPHLLLDGAKILGLDIRQCLMLGDSATDIEAARSATAPVVAYANKPGKRERFEQLGPDAIVDDMTELLEVDGRSMSVVNAPH
ncbi:HAD family hydrolase [Amycolatopsis sp. NPDC059657]|uniref:HAD family hydrolase n=1 Tax=Amycolatopsis sp. NPDC059657 TaxID=3346899 RepID=UPI00366B5978